MVGRKRLVGVVAGKIVGRKSRLVGRLGRKGLVSVVAGKIVGRANEQVGGQVGG